MAARVRQHFAAFSPPSSIAGKKSDGAVMHIVIADSKNIAVKIMFID